MAFCRISAGGEAPPGRGHRKRRHRRREEALGLLFLSSIPWLHYTAITQPTPVPADSNPRITWGKYALRDGRLCLPVTLLVNHALADGLHIAHFFEALRAEMDALAEQ